jgi:hypothetical protein
LIKILLEYPNGGFMLRKIADCMQIAQDVVHPLHPLQSVSQIAVGALSILSVPFTGMFGLVNGIAGISKGSLDAAQDIVEAGCTLKQITEYKPVKSLAWAHLTITLVVLTGGIAAALNPLVTIVAAKTSAVFLTKSMLAGICLL